ncbi:NAD(P)-dependent oxidoreductase [Bacillus sp. SCS-153A]|uniref:NAD(P)-dependent oxidoreductase n=1 Tax=Rossellomorea sedimentorum TaxID=3115294 RepID=UPI0039060A15
MNIALLGASGRVGSVILENALKDGHNVKALVRNAAKVEYDHPSLSLIEGNALEENDINACLQHSDVVISTLGTDKNNVLSKSMPVILKSMRMNSISRIITIGTAGILQSRNTPSLFRFQSAEAKRRSTTAAEDHLRAYLMLKSSNLNWTVVCPTYLPDGEKTGVYRTEKDILPEGGKSISVFDTGDYAYSLIADKESFRTRIGICY